MERRKDGKWKEGKMEKKKKENGKIKTGKMENGKMETLGHATNFGDFANFEFWREHYHTKILMNFFVGFLTNRLRFVPQDFSFRRFI